MVNTQKLFCLNLKGGVGKSAIAVNLSDSLARIGKKILLVDSDGQANATTHLTEQQFDKTLSEIILDDLPVENAIIKNIRPNLDLLPSNSSVRDLGTHLVPMMGNYTKIKKKMAHLDSYDYIIFDCAPGVDLLTWNIYYFCEEVLIPVSMDPFASDGTINLINETFKELSEQLDHQISIRGVIGTFYDLRNSRTKIIMEELREAFPTELFTTYIRINSKISEAPRANKTIHEYDKYSNGSKDFTALAEEFLQQEIKTKINIPITQ